MMMTEQKHKSDFYQKTIRLIKCIKLLTAVLFLVMVLSFVLWTVLSFLFPFPRHKLDQLAVSPAVLDIKGRTMISLVSSDDQWRQPVPLESISPWLIQATIATEDKRFFRHSGVDVLDVLRAAEQNIFAGRIVSGASTLDMQLCRMINNRPRTFWSKAVESFRALQLNQFKTKDEILELYLNNAPYGRNVRGVEMASLLYFAKHSCDLSIGEAALIAGLPKSPNQYRPDKNLKAAIKRRNTVLTCMLKKKMISEQQFKDANESPIVIHKSGNPQTAQHAAWMALKLRPQGGRTCINLDIQKEVERLANENLSRLPENSEMAIVIIDIAESRIAAMVGSGKIDDPIDGQVNGILARRSPGSTLKPFIYAAAFEAGRLNSESIVYDISIHRGGWSPANFDQTFSGEVSVSEALQRSLNVPAILIAEQIGLSRCCGILESAGVRLPASSETKSGLSLAVGGVESTLLDLTNAYATLGRQGIKEEPHLFLDEPRKKIQAFSPNVCAAINDILCSRHRCPQGMEKFRPDEIPWFMWKTGTSSGRRDAWAIGHNGRYAIGVWVGRFRGTGNVAYVGAEAAEPLLAKLFNHPMFRTNIEPMPAAPIIVSHPLLPPPEINETLHIIMPQNGETFIPLNGKTIIHPAANHQCNLIWFLNGKVIDAVNRLELTTGNYELHCIDQTGQYATVWFTVR